MAVDLDLLYQKALDIEALAQEILARRQEMIVPDMLRVDYLSSLTADMGLIRAGEIRVGNNVEPGSGFTGLRLKYPAMEYSGDTWHLVGVNADTMMFGVSASTGKLYAGGGNVILDDKGLSLWRGGVQRGAIDPTASANNYLFWLGESASNWKLTFDTNYALRLRGSIIISPNTGYNAVDALIHCPFDGPGQPGKDWTVSWQSLTGVVMRQIGNPNGHPGKFGKAIQIASSTTNLITNPSWETGIAGWTFVDAGSGGAYIRTSGKKYIGNFSARVLRGTGGSARIYSSTNTLPNNQYAHAFVWARAGTGGVARLMLRAGAGGTIYASMDTTAENVWQPLYVTYQNTTGADITNLTVQLVSAGGDNTYAWFDGCQLEIGVRAFGTPYADGSMGPGHSWSGSAHASTSSRTDNQIFVSGDQLGKPENMSLSVWVKQVRPITTQPSYIMVWYVDANNYAAVRINGDQRIRVEAVSGGVLDSVVSTSAIKMNDWNHIVAVWENFSTDTGAITLDVYVNGVLEGTKVTSLSSLNLEGGTVYIGIFGGSSFRLNGLLDDFLLVPYALTADDVMLINESGPVMSSRGTLSSTWTGLGRGTMWASADGLYAVTAAGDAVLAVTTVDDVSWGSGYFSSGLYLDAGDMVLGDNAVGKSCMWWDSSTGQIKFMGNNGSTVQVFVDTNGSLKAGSGNLVIDSSGLSLLNAEVSARNIEWYQGNFGTRLAWIQGGKLGQASEIAMIAWETSGVIPDAWAKIQAKSVLGDYAEFAVTSAGGAPNRKAIVTADDFTVNASRMFLSTGDSDLEHLRIYNTDVAHGMTDIAVTNVYFMIRKFNDNLGGARVVGLTEGAPAFVVNGYATTEVTGTTLAANANLILAAYLKSGTGGGSHGATGNLLVIRNADNNAFIFKGGGTAYADTSWTTFDEYDDVALLDKLESVFVDPVDREFNEWVHQNREELQKLDLVVFDEDGHYFLNFIKLPMLLAGAIRQLSKKVDCLLTNPKISAMLSDGGR